MISGLRERKRERNRALTAETAWRLFIERGYDNVTVADICEAAEIAPRTFHRYFPGKEDVVTEPLHRMAKIVADHIGASAPGESDIEVLRGAMTALARFAIDNRDLLIALRLVAERSHHIRAAYLGRPEHEHEIVGLLTARHPGADPDEWPRRLLVACTVATFRVWLEDYFETRFADPVDRLRTILDAVFTAARSRDGVQPSPGSVA
ncbi:TetR/AcrR family transcriptional regulator [Streptomyces sp. NPDC057257]|uniref:TetR/AcrR family transcriptional regulator n=1 Tax=Streptomyces sp. NPDC057257 TaxID=3346071 RepID=UPI00362FE8A2